MSTTHSPMPDFADALERHLRHAATELSAAVAAEPSAGPRPGPRPVAVRLPGLLRRPLAAAGSLATVAAIVVAVLLFSGSGSNAPRAQGGPLVLRTPLVDLPRYARPGGAAAGLLGPDSARITRGHEIPTAAGPAYLYGDDAGQCLTAPDAASPQPALERGVTCAPTAQLERFGIWLRIGEGYLVAAVPPGVRDPTLRVGRGTLRDLRPSSVGVVAVNVTRPAVVTFFDRDGDTSEVELGPIPVGRRAPATTMPDGAPPVGVPFPPGR